MVRQGWSDVPRAGLPSFFHGLVPQRMFCNDSNNECTYYIYISTQLFPTKHIFLHLVQATPRTASSLFSQDGSAALLGQRLGQAQWCTAGGVSVPVVSKSFAKHKAGFESVQELLL